MKKIIIIFPYILLILAIGIISYQQEMLKENKVLLSKYKIQDSTLLSMMIEDENGEYKESEDNSWPSSNYILNKDRSGCENGGTLEYQDNNVYVKAKSSDRCYVYFDIDNIGNRCRNQELASCLIANTASDTNLIYHDGKCDYEGEENCTLEAGDLSYRYSGANPNNYVCFGGDCSNDPNDVGYKYLYRIIGLFKNDEGKYEIKIIKADAATKDDLGNSTTDGSAYKSDTTPSTQYHKGKLTTYASYYWNSTDSTHLTANDNTNTNMWKDSNLNTNNLNGKFYNAINETYKNMVVEHKWEVGGYSNSNVDAKAVYDQELGDNKLTSSSNNCYDQGNTTDKRLCSGENDLTYKDEVGLMYISDYMYGTLPEYWDTTAYNYQNAEVKNNDWLYLGIWEWTISRYSINGYNARYVYCAGSAKYENIVYKSYGVRPVLYLSSNVKIIGGSGTDRDPFKLGM